MRSTWPGLRAFIASMNPFRPSSRPARGHRAVDALVRAALRRVRREAFVPAHLAPHAAADEPVPIGHGQTTSQPSLIAYMTSLLALRAGDRVLEIGTGSGFQTAVLAELANDLGGLAIYSVEAVPELAQQAAERLQALGYRAVRLRVGDGWAGWPEHAPYDAIVVTAAPAHLPPALAEQLAEGGRLVVPIGPAGAEQMLYRYVKHEGSLDAEPLLPVAFVPLLPAEAGKSPPGEGRHD
jgi:protein-L-isoaspartate(D-aspartate) O-methyltransferase